MTITLNITLDEAISEMEAIVEERGEDFIYKPPPAPEPGTCAYFKPDGTPSCGVGYLFDWNGIDPSVLKGDLNFAPLRALVAEGVIEMDFSVQQFLHKFQFRQDSGFPYRDALAEAKTEVGR